MTSNDDRSQAAESESLSANTCLIGGAAIGAMGVVGALVGGAVCPLCVVAAPALLGVGAIKTYRKRKAPPTDQRDTR